MHSKQFYSDDVYIKNGFYPLIDFRYISHVSSKNQIFYLTIVFDLQKKLQRYYINSKPVSLFANILHYSGAFFTTNELILINYY